MQAHRNLVLVLCLPLLLQAISLHEQGEPASQETRYYINDAVTNYIYGENGVENYFNMVTGPAVAVKCPLDRPFTSDGRTCFQCTLNAPIFNLSSLKCENCEGGNQNFKDHSCLSASDQL